MAWRRPGDKSLSEPMMVRLSTHICVTRPQWVNKKHSVQTTEEQRNVWSRALKMKKKYNDVIMRAMASQITGVSIVSAAICSVADKRNIKAPLHWHLCWDSPGHRWVFSQRASYAECISIRWHHHENPGSRRWLWIASKSYQLFLWSCFTHPHQIINSLSYVLSALLLCCRHATHPYSTPSKIYETWKIYPVTKQWSRTLQFYQLFL